MTFEKFEIKITSKEGIIEGMALISPTLQWQAFLARAPFIKLYSQKLSPGPLQEDVLGRHFAISLLSLCCTFVCCRIKVQH